MGRISALTELTSLASNDYIVVLDSSANIAKKITVANAFGVPEATWTATGETWVYASWTAGTRTGTITVPTNATTKYQAGMRIKISQSTGGTKYGIIHKVEATLLTVFFPVGTTLNNETISTPYYSSLKVPFGFDANPTNWTLQVVESGSSTTVSNPNAITGGTWNATGISLAVPIGVWRMAYNSTIQGNGVAATIAAYITIDTSATVTQPSNFAALVYKDSAGTAYGTVFIERTVAVTSPQTWQIYVGRGGSVLTNIQLSSPVASQTSFIRVISAYL